MRTDLRGFKIKTGFGLKSDFILLFPRHPRSIAFAFGCLRVRYRNGWLLLLNCLTGTTPHRYLLIDDVF
jgi:hypothetical protein